jgi:hypothetical protein
MALLLLRRKERTTDTRNLKIVIIKSAARIVDKRIEGSGSEPVPSALEIGQSSWRGYRMHCWMTARSRTS